MGINTTSLFQEMLSGSNNQNADNKSEPANKRKVAETTKINPATNKKDIVQPPTDNEIKPIRKDAEHLTPKVKESTTNNEESIPQSEESFQSGKTKNTEAIKKKLSIKPKKIAFYAYPDINEALHVRIMLQQLESGSLSGKVLSKIINEALKNYLSDEIAILAQMDNEQSDVRIKKAVQQSLIKKPLSK